MDERVKTLAKNLVNYSCRVRRATRYTSTIRALPRRIWPGSW